MSGPCSPDRSNLGATLPAVQITFSLLIVLQTWLSPLQGYLVDRFGPRLLIALGCLLSGAGWVLSSSVTTLTGLYLTYGLFCGIGTGIVYVGIIGLMVRWFPDRRGLATGVVAAGYGFGAIATTFPIDSMLKSAGYQHTLTCSASFSVSSGRPPRWGCASRTAMMCCRPPR
jgi:MFS family permease